MLGVYGRSITRAIFTPPARLLARLGVRPTAVTFVGTAATVVAAAALIGTGHLLWGSVVVTILLFADSLDGTLARLKGTPSRYGAFLDSTMDRIGDGGVFGAITFWAIFGMESGPARTTAVIAGICSLVFAATVPYARARGQAVGVDPELGIAERTDRLTIALATTGFSPFVSPWLLSIGLVVVAAASAITVGQRVWYVRKTLGTEQ